MVTWLAADKTMQHKVFIIREFNYCPPMSHVSAAVVLRMFAILLLRLIKMRHLTRKSHRKHIELLNTPNKMEGNCVSGRMSVKINVQSAISCCWRVGEADN
jgi:hypothetical protein